MFITKIVYPFVRPFLFTLPPELAHHLTLPLLEVAQTFNLTPLLLWRVPPLPCTVMGLKFPNPVGMAAGMDKDGEYIEGLAALGFGFIEVGTVTPRPQPGNPPPRLFRLPQAEALINRMGFNNQGVDHLIENLQQVRFAGILGINIGKNFDTPLEQAVEDYLTCFYKVYPYADYITINLSSPNTPGLRQLQHGEVLERLLEKLKTAQVQLTAKYTKYVPLVVKIAPDLTFEELASITTKLLTYEIDGVIATNTTLSRVGVENLPQAQESGGLSGKPLFARSTEIVSELNKLLQGKIPIIASGGVMTSDDALAKLQAGASLVQIYTGLIYRGPTFVKDIVCTLAHSQ
jgi:dihydroorotate dehydrogenase